MRKTLIYGIIALVVVLIAAAVAFFLSEPTGNGGADADTNGGFFGGLFPFNGGVGQDQPLFEGEEDADEQERPVPRLRQVSASPVSGAFIFERDENTVIRFIDRATGHVYETDAESTIVQRLTNTTVPGIQEVLWANENEFIIRYLDGDAIETFFVSLDPEADAEQSLDGVFVDSFARGVLDALGENLFAVYEDSQGSSLVLSDPDGSNARTILTSPIRSWIPLQTNTGLFVQTAPASGVEGFLYQITGGALTNMAGPFLGLTVRIRADGAYVAVSEAGEDAVILSYINTETGEVFSSAVDTFAEKCAFVEGEGVQLYCGVPTSLPEGEYPNDWLLGKVAFEDDIWLVTPEENVAEFIAAGDEVNQSFDVWQPRISPNGSHFIFINKNDLSLWSLRLEE